ncbi:2-methylcitrate dehydratase PrpD [Jatrophihabitans endophyticus]|uniref:2-methylcitrate dehydratase PrpD n=1 Tax=Jatrophihabitans endophyticus TaxID=1206085 RepID=A0A1M5M0U4_9ACTN|nr:MmgE/PrpD family protein [Jatrophihabitans endophyticus]SHG70962.1 2-methylcitrate dehydratase PrpD [Jatrophihabitans endophyticus]
MTAAPTVVQAIAALAARTVRDGLDERLRHDVVRRYLDLLGNSVAATELVPGRAVTRLVTAWGGREAATVIGAGLRAPAASAALVNGTLAHSLDFDDTHLPSVLHPSAAVLPAALAVAEATGAAPTAMLDAAAVGVEITCRLGMAGYDRDARASVFFDRGQHATSICGTLGAACAAAMLLGLDEDGIASAIGIAASMGAGVIEANRTGGTVKRVHCGWAAHSGVVAAEMAAAGITGPPTVIEGRFGFLQAWLGEHADAAAVTDGLGERWELPGIFFKPYPCNHFTHAGIDAALRLRDAGLRPEDVRSIELGAPSSVLRTIGEPAAAKARPESGYHAAFSGPFTVASALVGGGGLGLSHDDFTDEAARDPRRLALAATVTCVPDARCDEIFPDQLPAVVRVTTTDGRVLEERTDVNRGGPQHPLSDDELATKFAGNARRSFVADRADDLATAVLGLGSAPSLAALVALLRG